MVVCDGFVGDIALKSLEAARSEIGKLIRDEITRAMVSKLGGLFAWSAFKRVFEIDPFIVGGAPLLGVDGVVIIGYERSNEIAIKNAIGQARKAVIGRVIESIEEGLRTREQTKTK